MQLRQKEILYVKERDRLRSDMDLQRELDQCKSQRDMYEKEAELKVKEQTN